MVENGLPADVMCIDPGFFLTFPILTDLLGSALLTLPPLPRNAEITTGFVSVYHFN